jgi:hypothetical protein
MRRNQSPLLLITTRNLKNRKPILWLWRGTPPSRHIFNVTHSSLRHLIIFTGINFDDSIVAYRSDRSL